MNFVGGINLKTDNSTTSASVYVLSHLSKQNKYHYVPLLLSLLPDLSIFVVKGFNL